MNAEHSDTPQDSTSRDMSWYLEQLQESTPQLLVVGLATSDGLARAFCGVERAVADRAAAAVTGLQQLSREPLSDLCGTPSLAWKQTVVQLEDHTVVLSAAGERTYCVMALRGELTDPVVSSGIAAVLKAVGAMRHELEAAERSDLGQAVVVMSAEAQRPDPGPAA